MKRSDIYSPPFAASVLLVLLIALLPGAVLAVVPNTPGVSLSPAGPHVTAQPLYTGLWVHGDRWLSGTTPRYWSDASSFLASQVTNSRMGHIWTVGIMLDNGDCVLTFPSPGKTYPDVQFADREWNERYFKEFDKKGVDIWLELEPGEADVKTLIQLVLDRYSHHPCIRGVSLDVEWYHWMDVQDGRKVSNTDAALWEKTVQGYNGSYTLSLIHWEREKMPPTYRGSIIFVSDAQQFSSEDTMLTSFRAWSRAFPRSKVAYIVGYESDKTWWEDFSHPYETISGTLQKKVKNIQGVYWAGSTLSSIYPGT